MSDKGILKMFTDEVNKILHSDNRDLPLVQIELTRYEPLPSWDTWIDFGYYPYADKKLYNDGSAFIYLSEAFKNLIENHVKSFWGIKATVKWNNTGRCFYVKEQDNG